MQSIRCPGCEGTTFTLGGDRSDDDDLPVRWRATCTACGLDMDFGPGVGSSLRDADTEADE